MEDRSTFWRVSFRRGGLNYHSSWQGDGQCLHENCCLSGSSLKLDGIKAFTDGCIRCGYSAMNSHRSSWFLPPKHSISSPPRRKVPLLQVVFDSTLILPSKTLGKA